MPQPCDDRKACTATLVSGVLARGAFVVFDLPVLKRNSSVIIARTHLLTKINNPGVFIFINLQQQRMLTGFYWDNSAALRRYAVTEKKTT